MPPPLSILHVVNSLDMGGMENGIVNLANVLEARGFETHVACLERLGLFAQRLPDPSRVLVLGKTRGFSPGAAARLWGWQRENRARVIHSHNLGPLIYASLGTLFGRTVPLLQGEHSLLTRDELSTHRLRQRRWLYRACRGWHAVSRGIRTQLAEHGLATARMAITPNGVDTARFSPGDRAAARARFELAPTARVIGMIGRFGPFKRHLAMIEAFESLAPRRPELHLLITGGGGSEEETVAARVKQSPFAARLRWTGPQNAPEHCYRALDLLAVPSVNEGFSNAALEAMSCGVPVLANSGCGHEEIFTSGREGVIADLRSAEELSRQLDLWRQAPEAWAAMGARGRETAEREFSLRAMADRYEALYRELAASPA